MEMNTCPKCGAQITSTMKFCVECGRPLSACPKCGVQIIPTTKFCAECGYPLNADINVTAAAREYFSEKAPSQEMVCDPYRFEYRNPAAAVFLSIITAGIYFIFWVVSIEKDIQRYIGMEKFQQKYVWLYLLCPFYNLYWISQRVDVLNYVSEQRGGNFRLGKGAYIFFSLIGYHIFVLGAVQSKLNHYVETGHIKNGVVPVVEYGADAVWKKKEPHKVLDVILSIIEAYFITGFFIFVASAVSDGRINKDISLVRLITIGLTAVITVILYKIKQKNVE